MAEKFFMILVISCVTSNISALPFNADYYLPMEWMNDTVVDGFPLGKVVTLDANADNVRLVPGIRGRAAYFNGKGAFLDLGSEPRTCLRVPHMCPVGWSTVLMIKLGSKYPQGSKSLDVLGNGNNGAGYSLMLKSSQRRMKAKVIQEERGEGRPELKWDAYPALEFLSDLWTCVAVSWSPTGDLVLYVNDTVADTVVSSSRTGQGPYQTSPLLVGNLGSSSNMISKLPEITIDELMFWERSLELTEIDSICSTLLNNADEVEGHWSMVEVSGELNVTQGAEWGGEVRSVAACISRCLNDPLCRWAVYADQFSHCYQGNMVNPTVFAAEASEHHLFVKENSKHKKCLP